MDKRSPKKLIQRWGLRFCLWCSSLIVCLSLANGQVFGQNRTFELQNRVRSTYSTRGSTPGSTIPMNASADSNINGDRLIDPLGQVLNCGGDEFPDYTGFSVGVYEPAVSSNPVGNLAALETDSKQKLIANKSLKKSSNLGAVPSDRPEDLVAVGEVGALVDFTPTNAPGSPPPTGIAPNVLNQNPYFITNEPVNGRRGVYNFLLDVSKGQISVGRTYIVLINAPASLGLAQRRIQLQIESLNADLLSYSATALDGRPIGADGVFVSEGTVLVKNAANIPLSLIALQLNAAMCEARELQIIKTGDRTAAEPGDIASYRLSIKNLTRTTLSTPRVSDTLPLGFSYVSNSAIAAFRGNRVPVIVRENGNNLNFEIQTDLPVGNDEIQLAYAVVITPDGVRGSGRNAAIASATRGDNRTTVRDGPAIFTMRIRPGIVSDCGTLIGRVFVDKNFDGEQQNGEPGVPNAVIFMDDGNRIVTDANGIYSMSNVLPGARSLALDISSLPGYTLAPNLYFIERNSQSRLVRLSPGSLVRANFGVTPAFKGVGEQK